MLQLGGSSTRFLAQAPDVETFSLTETTLEPGFPGPRPHRHERMTDSFYVLEGTLAVLLENQTIEAGAGSFVIVPPGHVHTFSNPSSDPVRILNLQAPSGLEQYLKEVAAVTPSDGAPDPEMMAKIASRYDFHLA
jgi:mannose-6-phosphate isomerase-like protein (cupin superfamily)